MKLGFIGLGRMGFNMVLNLHDKKINVVAHNRSPEPVKEIKKHGVQVAFSILELMKKLPKEKIIWIMVTAGKPVDAVIEEILPFLKKNDLQRLQPHHNLVSRVDGRHCHHSIGRSYKFPPQF